MKLNELMQMVEVLTGLSEEDFIEQACDTTGQRQIDNLVKSIEYMNREVPKND
jgi:hypothetical protein